MDQYLGRQSLSLGFMQTVTEDDCAGCWDQTLSKQKKKNRLWGPNAVVYIWFWSYSGLQHHSSPNIIYHTVNQRAHTHTLVLSHLIMQRLYTNVHTEAYKQAHTWLPWLSAPQVWLTAAITGWSCNLLVVIKMSAVSWHLLHFPFTREKTHSFSNNLTHSPQRE